MLQDPNMKTLIFLAVISACSASIIPRVFYADEHVSESETSHVGKVKGNCVNRVSWREWKLRGGLNSVPLCGTKQRDDNNSGAIKKSGTQQSDHLPNSLNSKQLRKTLKLRPKLDEQNNWEANQNVRDSESKKQNTEVPRMLESEVVYVDSHSAPEATNLINSERSSMSAKSVNITWNETLQRDIAEQIKGIERITDMINKSENLTKTEELLGMDLQNRNATITLPSDHIKMLDENLQEFSATTDIASTENATALVNDTNNAFNTFNLSEVITLQFVTENISSIGSLSVNENHLMSEGGEIALFQDDSTSGFEFLIDSETAKNLLLTELLDSESLEATEEGETLLIDDEITGSELETIDSDLGKHKAQTNVTDSVDNNERISVSIVLNTGLDSLSVFDVTNLNAASTMDTDKEAHTVVHNSDTPTKTMECPTPGICFFWLTTRDKCIDNSHCEGSSMCCKIRCSKECINI